MKSKDDLKKWTFYLAGLVWLIAAAALVGWWLNIDFLKRPIPNLASMNPTTALGFSLSSIAFFLIFSTRFSTNPKRIGMVLSLFVFFLGFAKAVATIFDLPFHIDQVLFRERLADENSSIAMSSMSPNGALNLMLVGIILALGRIRPVVSQSISVFVFLLAWFPILGYIYQVPEFYGLLPFFPMAIHTAFCFILLSLAFFFSQPGIGWPSEFMSDFEGGRLVRVLIPLAIIVPTGMGYIRLWGYWTNLFSTEFGIALMVSGIILVFVWGVAYNAKRLNKRDYERTKISEELAKSGQSIKAAHEEIATINEELQATNEKMIAANEELLVNNEELNIVNEQLLAASEKIQVQSETIHRQKEERLNRVLESSNHIAWSFDLTGTGEDYISRSAEKIWGISSELFLRNKEISTEMVYPSDRELWGVARQRLNQFGQTQEICRFLDHQGQVRWMRIQVWITKDEHGALIRQEGVASDVSELEKSERALQNERKLLRSLIDNIPDYIFVKDKQSKHVINNRANVNLLGARNEVETLGKSLADFFGDSASTYLEDDRYVIASGLPLINKEEIIVTDSGARVLLTTKVPLRDEDGNITGLAGISRDITELRIQEQLLNQFRENMDIIFSNTVEEIVLMDREGKVILFNKALERFIEFAVGKKPEVGMYVWDMTVKERREIAKGLFTKALQGENIVVDAPIETSAGLVIHELNYKPVFVDGKVKYLTLISVDVTEKRARENLLRESEANLRSILNATQEAVILLNTDHEVITLNESYYKMAKRYSDVEIKIGDSIFDIVTPDRKILLAGMFAKVKSGEVVQYEVKRNEGWFYTSITAIMSTNNTLLRYCISVHDITSIKTAEATVRASEERFRALVENSNEIFMIVDKEANLEYITPNVKKVLGFNPVEIIEKGLDVLVHPDESDDWKNQVDKMGDWSIPIYSFTRRLRHKDGHWLWMEGISINLWETEGINGHVHVCHDITDRQENESEILRLNHSLSDFQNAIFRSSIVSRADKKGSLTFVNENFIKISGYSAEELIGQNHQIINSGHHPKYFWADMWKTIAGGKIWRKEVMNKTKEGSYYWVDTFIMPFLDEAGNVQEFLSIHNDITQRKTVEKHLEQSQYLLAKSNEVAQIGSWSYDPDFNKMEWNEQAHQIFGIPSDYKPNFEGYLSIVLKEDRAKVLDNAIRSFREIKSFEVEHRIVRKFDGALRWVHERADFIKDEKDSRLLVGIVQDITERKALEETLKEYNDRYEIVSKATNDAIWDWDIEKDTERWNHGMQSIFGYEQIEIDQTDIWWKEKIHPDDHERIIQELEDAFKNKSSNWISQYQYLCANGRYKYVLDRAYIIYREKKPVRMIGAMQDVTEVVRYRLGLEKMVEDRTSELNEALQKEKELVEMKSKFISIASHEFRTPLSTISLATGFIRKYHDKMKPPDVDAKLANIEKQVDHMAYLLNDVLLVGKADSGKMKINLSEIKIETFEALAREVIGNAKGKHKLLVAMECAQGSIISDEKLIRNIMMNLITNAVKFSPGEKRILMTIKCDHKNLFLRVKDFGIGIPPADLKNLFTSFSRGGNVGNIEGTGLGLSIVKKSCDLLGGKIRVQSEEGKGTEFVVSLPLKK